jgi:hypothetical protein
VFKIEDYFYFICTFCNNNTIIKIILIYDFYYFLINNFWISDSLYEKLYFLSYVDLLDYIIGFVM